MGLIRSALPCIGFAALVGCHAAPLRESERVPRPPAAPSTTEVDAEIFTAVSQRRFERDFHRLVLDDNTIGYSPKVGEFERLFSSEGWTSTEPSFIGGSKISTREPKYGRAIKRSAWQQITKSFAARNKEPLTIKPFKTRLTLDRATRVNISAAFKAGAWDGFHRHFPGAEGVLSFSLPGFSDDGALAVVQATESSGPRAAESAKYLLKHTAQGWRVIQVEVTMMA